MPSRIPLIYSPKVFELFRNPVNLGYMEDADAVAIAGSPACGDMIAFYLKIKDDKIVKATFESYGCAANIAAASMLTMMVEGKRLDEAWRLRWKDLAKELGGLPVTKYHCSALAIGTLKKAIRNYYEKTGKKPPWVAPKLTEEEKVVEEHYERLKRGG